MVLQIMHAFRPHVYICLIDLFIPIYFNFPAYVSILLHGQQHNKMEPKPEKRKRKQLIQELIIMQIKESSSGSYN